MSGRAPDVERRVTHGPVQPAEQRPGCSWWAIGFWAFIALVAQPIFLLWCGSIRL